MLFKPEYKYEIINETEYFEKMDELNKTLKSYVQSGFFTSFDKTRMYYEFFKVENPIANIVVIHGYTEFTKKYYELSWYFMLMGYNVFLYDVRCHGNSHRYSKNTQITHADSFEDYARDLDCFINQVVEPNCENAPVYIYSHSMGGAIAGLYLSNFKNKIKKAVLSSPMVYPKTPPFPRFVLKKLMKGEARKNGWNARFKFTSDFNPNAKLEQSNDISENRFKYNLDLRIKNANYQNSYGTNRWNYEAITVIEKLLCKNRMKNIGAKVLIISAEKDNSVKVKPQKKLAKLLKCEYKVFRGAKHCLYTVNDALLKEYVDTLVEFFCTKEPNT
ncbi:MAG: alpha/beta hydrolase [Clostridia bacterium]|nr:alpha/beta hydrolase [Clostridia bacterium]